jgi:type II secretory ATPase GspE/PulE/Tfp pilus assembly ATPase PilB-like protein
MMGVESYLLAPALQLIIAQRLVRKACPHCMTHRPVTEQEDAYITKSLQTIAQIRSGIGGDYNHTIPHTPGCEQCNGTGYIGRIALLEVMEVTADIREKIIDKINNTAEIMQTMRNNGFLTIAEDGLIKMLAGKTTIEELRRVV